MLTRAMILLINKCDHLGMRAFVLNYVQTARMIREILKQRLRASHIRQQPEVTPGILTIAVQLKILVLLQTTIISNGAGWYQP